MQILHIDTEKTWRGGENQMRLLIEGLRDRGVTCHIAAQPQSEIHRRLQGKVPLHLQPMRGELDFAAAKSIAQYCKQQQISILDCQTSHAHSLGLLCKSFFLPDIKLVIHRRVDYKPKANLINRIKYKHKAIDSYIAISGKIADILKEYGVAEEKIATVPSAIDGSVYNNWDRQTERQKWAKRLNIPVDLPLMGQAAAMTHQKGFDTFLEALALVKKEGLAFHCAIAGDGFLRSDLERRCQELGLQEQLTFLGWIDEVPSFLSSLDIFFMPSNFEGLGTTILEALYAGCCVVASDVGGIPEIITHEQSGLLAPVRDPQAFAVQLARALQAPQLRQSLNERGQQHADQFFSLKAMVEGNLKVYQSLLKEG